MSSRNVDKGGRSQVSFMRLLENNSRLAQPYSCLLDLEDVRSHNKEWDCWVILDQVVYDVTLYLDYHPGGKGEIMRFAGQDATDAFNTAHPWVNYQAIIGKLRVGALRRHVSNASFVNRIEIPSEGDFKTPSDSGDVSNGGQSFFTLSVDWLKALWRHREV
jgi:predicted heme/steroid binding protein